MLEPMTVTGAVSAKGQELVLASLVSGDRPLLILQEKKFLRLQQRPRLEQVCGDFGQHNIQLIRYKIRSLCGHRQRSNRVGTGSGVQGGCDQP